MPLSPRYSEAISADICRILPLDWHWHMGFEVCRVITESNDGGIGEVFFESFMNRAGLLLTFYYNGYTDVPFRMKLGRIRSGLEKKIAHNYCLSFEVAKVYNFPLDLTSSSPLDNPGVYLRTSNLIKEVSRGWY